MKSQDFGKQISFWGDKRQISKISNNKRYKLRDNKIKSWEKTESKNSYFFSLNSDFPRETYIHS